MYSRLRTTGIEMIKLPFKGQNILFYNVGGGQTERQEWIDSFDDVTAIVFVVSLSGYNDAVRSLDTCISHVNRIGAG